MSFFATIVSSKTLMAVLPMWFCHCEIALSILKYGEYQQRVCICDKMQLTVRYAIPGDRKYVTGMETGRKRNCESEMYLVYIRPLASACVLCPVGGWFVFLTDKKGKDSGR